MEIDFIITWVDGTDEKWKAEKKKYQKNTCGDASKERFRDYDILQYWFRAIELYAPWVNKIHFVTYGHLPKWLNQKHKKLHIVTHEDFIPKEYLPTFNSNVIELNFHRIEGLAEHFVYFNDDIFLNKAVKPNDFFKQGKVCDMLALQPIVLKPSNPVMAYIFLNNTAILSKYFDKRKNIKKQPKSYFKVGYPIKNILYHFIELTFPLFTGFYTVHGTGIFCKKTYEEIWQKEEAYLDKVCKNRFRSKEDVNQYLMREWQKLSGNFYPENIEKKFQYFELNAPNKLYKELEKKHKKIICVNDTSDAIDFDDTKMKLQEAFAKAYPKKSKFEY